jgi:hypothetical protein
VPLVGQCGWVVGVVVEHDHFALVVEVGAEGVDRQLAELPAEFHLLIERDVLLAKDQDLVAHERGLQCRQHFGTRQPPHVDAADFGPDVAAHADDFEAGRVRDRRIVDGHEKISWE